MNVMQLLLKRYKRRVNKVIKGGNVLSILFALIISLVTPPFNIFASNQTIIVPTYSSSSTESTWSSHLHVENYCEGTNASTNSCILKFTVDDNYYGMIAFDGYNGNTKWIDYQNVFIAGGYGEYHYNFWSSGQIVMNKVNINAVSLVLPNSNVDLTQIIQLLTSIESDTSSIDLLVNQTKTQIINVLNQLVISNGYLQTLTELRQWNFPIESFTFVNQLYQRGYDIVDLFSDGYYKYPIFSVPTGEDLVQLMWSDGSGIQQQLIIVGIDRNVYSIQSLNNIFTLDNVNIISFEPLYRKDIPNSFGKQYTIIKMIVDVSDASVSNYGTIKITYNSNVMPIFHELYSSRYKLNITTDFALVYGLSNKLLDNLEIIAQGTTQSNQSSSSLETQKGSFDTTSNNLYSSENAFNTDMNSKLQNIDTSFNPSTSFGSKFLSSANWVRTQFDNITSTTPFGTVLSFSMLLGLSLLIIGKVFK